MIYIGNSITYGVRLKDREKNSPAAVCTSLLKNKRDVTVLGEANCAISGRTTLDFLPGHSKSLQKVIDSATAFQKVTEAAIVFSIKLGTNDSAIQGPNGSPVSISSYKENMETIITYLLSNYPRSKVVIHHPIWYSANTYNRSKYLAEGLARLQSYFPVIDSMVTELGATHPKRIFLGDTQGFNVFKKDYEKLLTPENGQQGVFYLHPNESGAAALGSLWANAIYKALKKLDSEY